MLEQNKLRNTKGDKMKYIAHTKDGKTYVDEENCQLLKDHLKNVSKYSGIFSESFGAGEIGALLGLVHDLGKYQPDFQRRIRGHKIKVDHATQGAKILIEEFDELGRLYGMVVSGHHSGLKDSGSGSNIGDDTYSSRINKYKGQDINYKDEIIIPKYIKSKNVKSTKQYQGFAMATYLKMLFSSLVDADWTDTEEYADDIHREGIKYSIVELNNKLIQNLPQNDGSYINNIRADILLSCQEAALKSQGLFTLTVPTGGGKTLSSLSFALKHALKHDLKRIIYVIPYTSIIEQNADVVSRFLGKEYVLEDHSNVETTINDEGESTRLKWAMENWDIPIIFTTNVQFFESLFSNKPSKTRKLHNISQSVVIFDEAQMLPRELLSPSMYMISELVMNYKVTAVLCSATQPAISKYKYKDIKITEIIDNPNDLFKKLKRVEYIFVEKKDDQDICNYFVKNRKVLCIVNTRKHAYKLYQMAKEQIDCSIYYLSTLMHPIHRRETLKLIKKKLDNNHDVIVISTSLIEAGVDIDFPIVLRSISGIDSIIQAGGRANREGKLELGRVLIFEPTSDEGKIPKSMQSYVSITKEVFSVLKENAFNIEGIKMYFELLYNLSSTNGILDMKNLLSEFELSNSMFKLNFETVAKKYKIIEEKMNEIIIDSCDESKVLISELRNGSFRKETLRKLQQYTVSVYVQEYVKLLNEHAIDVLNSGHSILCTTNYYNNEIGLDIFSEDNKNAECNFL